MTVEAILKCGGVFRTMPLTQYDEGQMIHLTGITLPASYLAEFSNSEMGTAEQITQTTDTVTIPGKYLTSGSPVYVWIVVVGQDERTTRYEIIVPVRGRGEPDNYVPTPEEQTAIEAAIAALNEAVTAAGVAIEHYPRITDGIWQVWDVTNGEWISTEVPAQGPQGETGATGATGNGIASAVLNADYTLTLTFTNGTTYTTPSIRGAQGAQGDPGPAGQDGADGYSPTATVSKSGGVATITITDKDGTTTAQVSDGATGQTGPAGADGSPGSSAYVWIRYAAAQPTQDSDMKTTPDAWMGIYSGDSATAPTAYTAYTWYNIKGQTGPVTDVQVNGSSILNNGVANVPIAGANRLGAVKYDTNYGVYATSDGTLCTIYARTNNIKSGANQMAPIVPYNQHESTFYGLAKAAGDSTQSASSNAVGSYTEEAKVAIQKMLGIYEAPYELLNDITLETEAQIDLSADSNGTPYNLEVYLYMLHTQRI